MNDLSVITEFLGWCTLINYGILILSTVMLITCSDWVKGINSKIFNIPESSFDTLYFPRNSRLGWIEISINWTLINTTFLMHTFLRQPNLPITKSTQ